MLKGSFRSAREGVRSRMQSTRDCCRPPALRATPSSRKARRRRAQGGPPSTSRRGRGVGDDGSWDDARTGVLPGVPGAQGAFEDWMARWFPRFASRIAFRCVLHPRESRDIRRRELFRGFVSRGHARRGPQSASKGKRKSTKPSFFPLFASPSPDPSPEKERRVRGQGFSGRPPLVFFS